MGRRKKVIVDTTELMIPTQEDILKLNTEKGFPSCIDGKLHKWRKIEDCESEEDKELSEYDLIISAKVMCENCKLEGIGTFRLYLIVEDIDEQ